MSHKRNYTVIDPDTGKEVWVSRSVVVKAIVIVEDEPNGPDYIIEDSPNKEGYSVSSKCSWASTASDSGESYTLKNDNYVKNIWTVINKRGHGCPSHVGEWNCPCGYLDWGETLEEACTREVLEENKIYIDPSKWVQMGPATTVLRGNEAVKITFTATITLDEYKSGLAKGIEIDAQGEPGEVEDTQLMLLTPENINAKKWAFDDADILMMYTERPLYIY